MNTRIQQRSTLGAIKGILYMRIQELVTPMSLIRIGIVFALSFILLMLLRYDSDDAVQRFQGLIGGVFALKFLPVFCLTKGGEALRGELKEGTIEYLWVRPASKVELYIGFMLSSFLGSFAIVGSALLGISLAGVVLGVTSFSGLMVLWLTVIAVVASFTAISGALSSFSSKFVVLGIFYYGFVELGLGSIPNGVQRLAVCFHAKTLLTDLAYAGESIDLAAFAWIVGIGAIAFLLGTSIFSQSRYVVGSEKEA